MILLNQIVDKMLREHIGGEKFFENLDKAIQDVAIMEIIVGLFPEFIDNNEDDKLIIVSGNFGRFFSNLYSFYNIVAVKGGLRKNPQELIGELEYLKDYINGKECVFVDDSFYSGKTRDAVKAEIERCGGALVKTVVVYDGSKKKDPTVESLYRYYDENELLRKENERLQKENERLQKEVFSRLPVFDEKAFERD